MIIQSVFSGIFMHCGTRIPDDNMYVISGAFFVLL